MGAGKARAEEKGSNDKKSKSMFKKMMAAAKGKSRSAGAGARGTSENAAVPQAEGVDQEVFIDFMIEVLIQPANIKKRVLERLLTLSVKDDDWDAAKRAATLEYVQVAMASEVQVTVAPSAKGRKEKKGDKKK